MLCEDAATPPPLRAALRMRPGGSARRYRATSGMLVGSPAGRRQQLRGSWMDLAGGSLAEVGTCSRASAAQRSEARAEKAMLASRKPPLTTVNATITQTVQRRGDGQHQAGHEDHRAVVADQLHQAHRQRGRGDHAGRVRAGLHHRGDQVDHPGAGEGRDQPGRRRRRAAPRRSRPARRPGRSARPRRRARRRRAPAALPWPVTRASCPSAQSRAYATCQPTSATRPTAQAGTVAGGDRAGERHHGDRGGQPEHQVGEGQRGRAQPEPLARPARRPRPSHWLIASLNRPPPRLTA